MERRFLYLETAPDPLPHAITQRSESAGKWNLLTAFATRLSIRWEKLLPGPIHPPVTCVLLPQSLPDPVAIACYCPLGSDARLVFDKARIGLGVHWRTGTGFSGGAAAIQIHYLIAKV